MSSFFKKGNGEVYGWIKSNGEIVFCGMAGHYRLMPEEWQGESTWYSKAYENGWVRFTSYFSDVKQALFMEVYGNAEAFDKLEAKVIDLAFASEMETTEWNEVDENGNVKNC